MKRLTLAAASILFSFSCFAKTVDGYIILPNNDTVHAKIRATEGLFGFYNPNKGVDVTDSSGKTTRYTPQDLKGWGWVDKSGHHDFLTKPIQDSSGHPSYFLEVFTRGPRASAYSYLVRVGAGNNISYEEYFTFEKPDGAVLFLKSFDRLETLRKKLGAFYADNPQLQQFIDKRFEARGHIQRDIMAFLSEVNKAG